MKRRKKTSRPRQSEGIDGTISVLRERERGKERRQIDSAASLHTEELSRRSNAVCPTSLDSHKFHYIVRPAYQTFLYVPSKPRSLARALPGPPRSSLSSAEVTIPLEKPSPSLRRPTPLLLLLFISFTPVQSLQCEINSSPSRTQRNHEVTQRKKVYITRELLASQISYSQ